MCCDCTELPGPNIPLPCGYQAIAEHFAEGLDIRVGQRVTRVHHDASGVRVVCESGVELRADAVIVTVSLGVLKVRVAIPHPVSVPPRSSQGECKGAAWQLRTLD